jgi:hypothetical protein
VSALRAAIGRGILALALVASLAAAAAVSATASPFPVPSCGWASSSLVGRTFGDPVRAETPAWSTFAAPVLTCRYLERRPKLQIGNDAIVVVQYAELQRYRSLPGASFVKRLGRCLSSSTCPKRNRPAWLLVQRSASEPGLDGTQSYVTGVDLRVQDGLNAIEILVDDPNGPLTVGDGVAQVEKLARTLLPKFFLR